MTNLLLKTKTELFKLLRERERERERERDIEREREREREGERETGSDSGGEFREAAGIYIIPLFQFKVPRTNCEQHSRLLPEHVNMFI